MRGDIEEVEVASTELVIPGLATLVNMEEPAQVAQALADIRSLENQLREIKSDLSAVLIGESARQGSKTLRFGDLTVEVSGGTSIEWDLDELAKLQAAGLPEERYDALVRTTVSQTVSAAEAKRIAAVNSEYARIIERARTDREVAPRVSVK